MNVEVESTETERDLQIVPTLGFRLLIEAEEIYNRDNKFSSEILQSLYAVFGNALIGATELLESGTFMLYKIHNGTRQLLKVVNRNEQYALFVNIDFCHCHAFKYQVLHLRNAITCKHVLAGKLARICGRIKTEIVTDNQLADLLNYQCEQHSDLWT